ncbi:MAG: AmmeMemoRadiSam system radical SAM enzyme [Nitrososphaerota archaeon]|nr:AmmeMemoRadiSam system radical SAM enzyme [Nitrososphaerota archaeon]MDG6941535.1 AmmeMemoRadiSam system radical SAM enzyme [Nitrososphaerota archaeon]MDG6951076.1 AmmeMemoRadiSam system radical SAM enzyme [Nitrososphaerota archaeon]
MPRLTKPEGREAELFRDLRNGRIQCTACARACQIGEGQVGFCGIRGVVGRRLYLLDYGRIMAAQIDPIEKKPVVHYRPGSKVFSIATSGCSWACRFCQNYDISQRRQASGIQKTPEELVATAAEYGCEGVAYTYNQPSVFIEYARDVGKIARSRGLFNIFVSNGFDTPEAVAMMKEFLDCITVDFKGSGETDFVRRYISIPDAQAIFQTLLDLKQKTDVHIEITDLIVPAVGDSLEAAEKLSRWVYDNLGPDTPIHFLRFHPDYKMMDSPSTPIETLERHVAIGRKTGLNYVYIGNVPGHPDESTYCPGCKAVLIKRYGYEILEYNLDGKSRCRRCGYRTSIVGPLSKSFSEDRFVSVTD